MASKFERDIVKPLCRKQKFVKYFVKTDACIEKNGMTSAATF